MPSGRSTHSCSRRTGSCQHTSGLVSSGLQPGAQRQRVQRAADRRREARHGWRRCRRRRRVRVLRRSSSSPTRVLLGDVELAVLAVGARLLVVAASRRGVSCSANSRTRFSSSLSEKNAPWLQQPSSAWPSTVPWQPRPKMHVQREHSQVRSARIRCSASAGIEELDPLAGEVERDLGGDDGQLARRRAYETAPCASMASRDVPCGSACWTSARTPFTCSSSTPTAAPSPRRSCRTRASCGWPSTSTSAATSRRGRRRAGRRRDRGPAAGRRSSAATSCSPSPRRPCATPATAPRCSSGSRSETGVELQRAQPARTRRG